MCLPHLPQPLCLPPHRGRRPLVVAGLGSASARMPLGRKLQREFDYFALALLWPGTICASTPHCCIKNGCCRCSLEPIQTLTIHGLWPDYDDRTWPSCCRHTNFVMDDTATEGDA